MSAATATAPDPGATIRGKSYRILLVFAALIGVWFRSPPGASWNWSTGSSKRCTRACPAGWACTPSLVVAASPTRCRRSAGRRRDRAAARSRRSHPLEGIKAGTAKPAELPGILLAALATLGLGLVLGPEAPLIALGGGLAILTVRLAREGHPRQARAVLAASAAFAAIATIFGSPVIGAIILIEAAGLGGPICR